MPPPVNVLVVCVGNVCRSPLAERLLRLRLDTLLGDASGAVHVTSAGVRALVGAPMDAHAAAELLRLGGDPSGFASSQVTPAVVGAADLVLTATTDLRSRVLQEAPRALRRTFTLLELASMLAPEAARPDGGLAALVADAAALRGSRPTTGLDVPDPVRRSAEVHREVADLLDDGCTRIARALAAVV